MLVGQEMHGSDTQSSSYDWQTMQQFANPVAELLLSCEGQQLL